jgi:PAS domain S-box-containing protein
MAWFTDDADGLDDFWQACAGSFKEASEEVRNFLIGRAALRSLRDASPGSDAAATDERWFQLVTEAVRTRDFSAVEKAFAEVGRIWSRADVPLHHWYEATDLFRKRMQAAVFACHAADPERLSRALLATHRYADSMAQAMAVEYVTERERVATALRARLEEALMHQRRLSESGLLGIFVSDFTGRISEANDAFLALLGYSSEELVQLNWTALTPPEWSEWDQAAIEQLRATGKTKPWEKEYWRKDGTRVPVLVGVAMLNDSQGIAFVLDISERRRLEELRRHSAELEALKERFAEAARAKGAFVASLSHELRTPLTSILGFAELLHDESSAQRSAQQREFAAAILTAGQHVLQLLNDVLDLSKIEAGKMQFQPHLVDIAALIAEVVGLLRPAADARGVALSFTVAEDVAKLRLDPLRLRQVLYNLTSNAIKFTQASGSVRVEARREGDDMLCVSVHDTGIGIREEDQALLFQEFQQVAPASRAGQRGTGLGLALTKRMVEAQGGRVGVESRPGIGSKFSVLLPSQR